MNDERGEMARRERRDRREGTGRRREREERTIHEDVDKQDLHRVERVGHSKGCRDGDDREGSDGGGELEDQEVLDVVEDRFS